MYLTGWRKSEVIGLEWRQVDLKAGTVTLDPGTTKNDEGRVFPFTSELRELLEDRAAERDGLKQAGHIVPWVFFRMVGTRRDRKQKQPTPIDSFRSSGSRRVAPPARQDAFPTTSGGPPCGTWCAPAFLNASR